MAKVINQINVGDNIHNIASTAYATCETAAGTAAKVAYIQGESSYSSGDFVLTAGVTVHVKFTNANSVANPTLNINGTGAKSIKRYGTTAPGTANTSSWYAGEVVTLTYDGAYWQMNKTVDNNTDNDKKTSSGDTSSKIYLVGATSQSTSGQTTYSHDTAYVGTDGYLYSNSKKVDPDAYASKADLEELENIISGNINYLDADGNFIPNSFDGKKVRFTALVDSFYQAGTDCGVNGEYATFSDGSKLGLIIDQISDGDEGKCFWGYRSSNNVDTILYAGGAGSTYTNYYKNADYIEVDFTGLMGGGGNSLGMPLDDSFEYSALTTDIVKATASSSSSGGIDGITSTEDKIVIERDTIEVGTGDSVNYTISMPKKSGTLTVEYSEAAFKPFSQLKVGEDLSGVTLQFNTSAYPQPYGSTYYDYTPNIYLEFANGYRFGLNAEGSGGYQYGLFDINNQLLYTFFNDNGAGGQDGWKMESFTMPSNSVVTNIYETTDMIMDNIYGEATFRVDCESLYKALQNKADVYTGVVSLAGTLNNFYQMNGPCYGPDVCGRIDGGNTGFVLYCPDSNGSVDLYYSSDLANRTADVHLYNHGGSSIDPGVLSGSGSVAQIKASSIEWDMSAFTNNYITEITQADLDAAIQCVHATPKTNFEAIQTLKEQVANAGGGDVSSLNGDTVTITATNFVDVDATDITFTRKSTKLHSLGQVHVGASDYFCSTMNSTGLSITNGNCTHNLTHGNSYDSATYTLSMPLASGTIATQEWVAANAGGGSGSGSSSGGNVYYGTCSTASNTSQKDVTCSNFTSLTTGATVIVKFTNINTITNPTLKVGSTTAKSIKEYGATNGALTSRWNAGGTATFVYDGTYWLLVSTHKDSTTSATNYALGQGYGTCSTAAATLAKTVSLSNYILSTGGIVSVYFTYAVPASATLNINSRGAKPIFYRNAAIAAGIIGAGDTATFIYDGTYYRLISIDYAPAESQRV